MEIEILLHDHSYFQSPVSEQMIFASENYSVLRSSAQENSHEILSPSSPISSQSKNNILQVPIKQFKDEPEYNKINDPMTHKGEDRNYLKRIKTDDFFSFSTKDTSPQNLTHISKFSLSKHKIDQEKPSCSSHVSWRSTDVAKKIKSEPEFIEIDHQYSINDKNRDRFNIKEEETFQQETEEKKPPITMAFFYQSEICRLIHLFDSDRDDSILSQGPLDYKRVQVSRVIGYDIKRGMGLDVLDAHLISFDQSLFIPKSFHYISKNPQRRIFQIMIKNQISYHVRSDVFSSFVYLSLGKQKDSSSYVSWKKLVSEKLCLLSEHVKKRMLESNPKTSLGRVKGGICFSKYWLSLHEKVLIKEVLRHALFHISMELEGKFKNIFVAKSGMGLFLNKYSDIFLKEFTNHENKNALTKKMEATYFSWRRMKNVAIKKIIDKMRPKFQTIFESDHEAIQKRVLVLESSGFRPLRNDEFQGLLNFIKQLLDSRGYSGIAERACLYFYREEYDKRCASNPEKTRHKSTEKSMHRIFTKDQKNVLKNDSERNHKSSMKMKNESVKTESNKNQKVSCFKKVAEGYRQMMSHFLEEHGKLDGSMTAKSIYDHKRVQYSSFSNEHRKTEIEVMENYILSFDSSLSDRPFKNNPFSRNALRKMFQTRLREKVHEMKEVLFINFLTLSLPVTSSQKKESYISWKTSIIKTLSYLSNEVAIDFFGKSYKEEKKTNHFVERYSFACSANLVKEILRYALFSIPIESDGDSGHFFISRSTFSHFLNKYSDYFLNSLLKYGKINRKLLTGGSSYMSWKKLRIIQINQALESSQSSFEELIKIDYDKIREEVLVLEKSGFREMTDKEFQCLTKLVCQLVKSKSPEGFINRTVRHFYIKKNHQKIA